MITIPANRVLPLEAKAGGGYRSMGYVEPVVVEPDPVVPPPDLASANLAFESFSSGTLTSPDFNAAGFSWSSKLVKTSVVTVNSSGEKVVLYNSGGTAYNVDRVASRDWAPREPLGNSLRFRYPAASEGLDPIAEQRWTILSPSPDVWVRWWVRVPVNYTPGPGSPNNHKLMAIWTDVYSGGAGAWLVWEFWGSGTSVNATFLHSYGNLGQPSTPHQQSVPFFTTEDRGRWMELIMHVKASSIRGVEDGAIEMYRRWDGDPVSARQRLHNLQGVSLPLPSDAPGEGWKAGYFMGWANGGYTNETEWLVDQIAISSESLL